MFFKVTPIIQLSLCLLLSTMQYKEKLLFDTIFTTLWFFDFIACNKIYTEVDVVGTSMSKLQLVPPTEFRTGNLKICLNYFFPTVYLMGVLKSVQII